MWSIESSSPLIVCSRCGRVFEKMWSVSPSGGQIKPKRTNQILRRQRPGVSLLSEPRPDSLKTSYVLASTEIFQTFLLPIIQWSPFGHLSYYWIEVHLLYWINHKRSVAQINSKRTQNWLFYMFGFFLCNFHFLSIYKIDFLFSAEHDLSDHVVPGDISRCWNCLTRGIFRYVELKIGKCVYIYMYVCVLLFLFVLYF